MRKGVENMASGGLSLVGERNRLSNFRSLEGGLRQVVDNKYSLLLPEALYPVVADDVGRALNDIIDLADPGDYTALTDTLIDLLSILKETFSDLTWREAVLPAARSHAIADLVHECPFTWHSFSKPRGYPGDAGLIDFVYRHPAARPAQEAATKAGRTVMTFTVDVTACEAVRHRRSILAAKIDEAAARREMPSILSLASGHLREAELSIALKEGRVGRLLAVDQDAESLATVEGYCRSVSRAIEPRQATVRQILAGRTDLGRFDLVYAAGLYDYLDARVAARLTRVLFDHLKEGGRLLIPNFLWGVREEAYMEVFMDWHLLYRTPDEIQGFAQEIAPAAIRNTRYTQDDAGTIGYLEIERI
ncbi:MULTISPECIES: class I SAM-dependent methyltransferase [unclassified Methylobacterium]|uniref:class I SAM-dependent methyltransferase n=1 Tax=unclassified Methylobacterium TaxID=2615210 RepID=UPI000B226818|nr:MULTISPECIES: class I SAM-dependent methyltransferase [unclassified Methylobacterium]